MEVCHFKTTKSDDKLVTLDNYLKNMSADQDKIYYLAADSIEAAKNSPQLEGFLKKNIEVVLLTDPVDDFWVNVNHEYKTKELVSITRAGLDIDDSDKDKINKTKKEPAQDVKDTIAYFKEILGDKVFDVVESKKLSDSPVCLTTQEGGMDMRMERFLIAQKQLIKATPKIMEINSDHNIIKFIGKNTNSDKARDLVELLFDEACIIEGETINDTNAFSKRFNNFLEKLLVA
jgi:molecular chaperone HtpG